MRFMELPEGTRDYLHKITLESAEIIGGKNFFLQMIEDIRSEKQSILLNKSCRANFSYGKISWTKSIFPETFTELLHSIRREDKLGDIFAELPPKNYKRVMNTVKTLKPITIDFQGENGTFTIPIIDASTPKKSRFSMLFKIIFFYDFDFVKKSLNYKKEVKPDEPKE